MFHGSNPTMTTARAMSKSTMSGHDRICRIVQRNVARVACECAREAAAAAHSGPQHPIRPWRRAA